MMWKGPSRNNMKNFPGDLLGGTENLDITNSKQKLQLLTFGH
jgi:hypothetical protein